jgi:hypothetical protein
MSGRGFERSLGSLPVVAGGSATYLSQPPVPVVTLTGDYSACAPHATITRQRAWNYNCLRKYLAVTGNVFVCSWHLADSLTGFASRPLSGVKQTFPATVQLMPFYEYTA